MVLDMKTHLNDGRKEICMMIMLGRGAASCWLTRRGWNQHHSREEERLGGEMSEKVSLFRSWCVHTTRKEQSNHVGAIRTREIMG
jgi:hypothetical protein